ncbi:hypothetical protein PN498_07635 [Oscillatoria sp. CS-180]|uniref:hypothetical protein n=1 Tax=Oscillatoria sp. CS-180 TaxID=3021720 RepID=UPI00232FC349|nr:hypothetical protein [Oscillatoria sp. CS-180]MDB9525852.1 hypothetical protein [Oscillatoria sp. CS-180]
MFLDELSPFLQELARQPVAFLGGFVSGVLRLDLDEDPVKSWLNNQNVSVSDDDDFSNGSGPTSGPQQISID